MKLVFLRTLIELQIIKILTIDHNITAWRCSKSDYLLRLNFRIVLRLFGIEQSKALKMYLLKKCANCTIQRSAQSNTPKTQQLDLHNQKHSFSKPFLSLYHFPTAFVSHSAAISIQKYSLRFNELNCIFKWRQATSVRRKKKGTTPDGVQDWVDTRG